MIDALTLRQFKRRKEYIEWDGCIDDMKFLISFIGFESDENKILERLRGIQSGCEKLTREIEDFNKTIVREDHS